jgi:hypothetical protein
VLAVGLGNERIMAKSGAPGSLAELALGLRRLAARSGGRPQRFACPISTSRMCVAAATGEGLHHTFNGTQSRTCDPGQPSAGRSANRAGWILAYGGQKFNTYFWPVRGFFHHGGHRGHGGGSGGE